MPRRVTSLTGALARAGFTDTARAARFAEAPALAGLADPDGELLKSLGQVADPDLALRSLVRIVEAAGRSPQLDRFLGTPSTGRDRLFGVLGQSAAMGDHLTRHPEHLTDVRAARPVPPEERTAALVAAVAPAGRGEVSAYDALRIAYARQLLGIMALDVTAPDPQEAMPAVAAALADLAAAALEGALAIAKEEHPAEAEAARLAVIAMGKCGGRELNYVSDVDVIFVAEPATGRTEEEAIAAATHLATALMRAASLHTGEGALWQVDPALRPEGKAGPLVRTVASHQRYYRRWAKTWEFQALLKARPVAGDAAVGQAYLEAICPLVWEAAGREHFITDVQQMRLRVEQHIPATEVDRQLKLGPGGLRDVEFSVQLLQLVHGRTDTSLRSRTTLTALAALSDGGYVGREDAQSLATAYRFMRSVEHRVQFYKMKRTHLMPTRQGDLDRIGRALRYPAPSGEELLRAWEGHKRTVRQIHKLLFYRPLLSAVAQLSPEEARLTPEAARERLAALGFRDPRAALRHLESLTQGVTRAAAIRRTLLPVMLGWFAEEVDPDTGLLAFRRISESLDTSSWYLRMLRDEGKAAQHLAHVLARSRFAAGLLEQAPEAARILSEGDAVTPRTRDAVYATMSAAAARQVGPEEAMTAARGVRRTELFRLALGDLIDAASTVTTMRGISDLVDAVIQVALDIATRTYAESHEGEVPVRICIVAMGRLGGHECAFSSDADVIAVHEPEPGVSDEDAFAAAREIVQQMRSLLAAPGPDPSLGIDMDLRPEGKAGALSRTPEGYASYLERWGQAWERQALLRARPCAGDKGIGQRFTEVIAPFRWPAGGLDAVDLREIRRLKARMEAERLPRGADPQRHFKLGPGGLSDVEWTVQLLQLSHAHEVETLRTTQTLRALHAAVHAQLLTPEEGRMLEEAWLTASRIRDAVLLWRGRGADTLPESIIDAEAVARVLGWGPGSGIQVAEHYRRVTRHARDVMMHHFYGQEER